MGKRIYWILLVLITLAGLGVMVYLGKQPRSVTAIDIGKFENSNAVAKAILTGLQVELRSTSVVLLGLEYDRKDQQEIWQHFLNSSKELEISFDEIFIDQTLRSDLFQNAKIVNFREDFKAVLSEIETELRQNKKIALIAPTPYSAQSIPGNLAFYLNSNLPSKVISLSLVDFPRSREEEKNMNFPCVVEGVDQSGLGPFGCLLVQSSRVQYRNRYRAGDHIAFVNKLSELDYIVFYTQEK